MNRTVGSSKNRTEPIFGWISVFKKPTQTEPNRNQTDLIFDLNSFSIKNKNNNFTNSNQQEYQIDYGESENHGPESLGSIIKAP